MPTADVCNPDVVERRRLVLSLAPDDEATWCSGGDEGYLTFSTYRHGVPLSA